MPAANENEITVNHLISDITHGYDDNIIFV